MDYNNNFEHKMYAHCETGTLVSLLNNAGYKITEAMVFGLASGIFFGYLDTKVFSFPTFIVRSKPGEVRKNLSKVLNIKLKTFKFKDADKGMQKLDNLLAEGKVVGAQVDFFYMDYFPQWMRVHNNVHFINIIGKEGNDYIISDSYNREIAKLDQSLLKKARWAGGNMAPKGFLYYPEKLNPNVDLKKVIPKTIKKAARNMLNLPLSFIGVKGIYKFADKLKTWSKQVRDIEHFSHEIIKINILLEEQGTGGAGFRYMYAAYLKQAGEIMNSSVLNEMSEQIMQIGDDWRNISYFAAKIGKNRDLGEDRIAELSEMIRKQGDAEKIFFTKLKKVY